MLWERERDWDCVSRLLEGELLRELTPSLLWLRWATPDAPMGEVAGVMLWTLRPRLWEGPGADAAIGGPGGFSRWGEVRGVVGWEVCPPASRARRLRRISSALSSSIAFLLMVKGVRERSSVLCDQGGRRVVGVYRAVWSPEWGRFQNCIVRG